MTDDAQLLSQLSAYMQSLPTRAPETLVRSALTTVATTRQRRGWIPSSSLPVREWRISRAAFAAGAAFAGLVILVVLAQVFSRLPNNLPPATQPVLSSPSPTAPTSSVAPTSRPEASGTPSTTPAVSRTTNFSRSFSFDASGLEASVRSDMPNLFDLYPRPSRACAQMYSSIAYPSDSNGLIVVSTALAAADHCPHHLGSADVPMAPGDDAMSVLHDEAGMTFVTNPASLVKTVAGKPAIEVSVIATVPGSSVRAGSGATVPACSA